MLTGFRASIRVERCLDLREDASHSEGKFESENTDTSC
jgi:hypothetical protein